MGKTLDDFYKKQSLIYKYVLYFISIALIVFFFPRGGKFKYEFQKGKPWQYDNLYAPFDFSINKTDGDLVVERKLLEENKPDYYTFDQQVYNEVISKYADEFENVFSTKELSPDNEKKLFNIGNIILDSIYNDGLFNGEISNKEVFLIKNNTAKSLLKDNINYVSDGKVLIENYFRDYRIINNKAELITLIESILKPNVSYNKSLSDKALQEEFSKISLTRGNILEGKLIIAKGEVVESDNYNVLSSLKQEFESELWKGSNYYFILFGYTV